MYLHKFGAQKRKKKKHGDKERRGSQTLLQFGIKKAKMI